MFGRTYTTGEFAKLCGTTKDTLFLYDRKGILKPDIVKENGYRRYNYMHWYIYWTIKFFKTTGLSLDEISDIQKRNVDDEELINIFTEKQAEISKEQLKLASMQRFIEKNIQCIKEGKKAKAYIFTAEKRNI